MLGNGRQFARERFLRPVITGVVVALAASGWSVMGTAAASTSAARTQQGLVAEEPHNGERVPDPSAYRRAKAAANAEAARIAGAQSGSFVTPAAVSSGTLSIGRSFDGITDPVVDPPDTTSAVGTKRMVEVINNQYGIYDRSAQLLSSGSSGDLFGTSPQYVSDPQVAWDPQSSRFYFAVFENRDSSITTGPDEGIAWGFSKTASPSGPADFCKYFNGFTYGKTSYPDYPRLGLSSDFVLVGSNRFSVTDTYLGADVAWLSKPAAGSSCPTQASFKSGVFADVRDANGAQLFTPVPARQTDPSSTGWVVAGPGSLAGSALTLFRVDADPATHGARLGAATQVAVKAFSVPANAAQAGTDSTGNPAPPVGTLAGKLMQAYSGIDPWFGHTEIWTAHTVFGGAGAEVRWYEIDPVASRLDQSGAISDPSRFMFNGTIAPDRAVNGATRAFGASLAATVNSSSSTSYPQILTIAKADNRPQTTPVVVTSSPGPKLGGLRGGVTRWGDYSGASPDPAPGTTGVGRVWLTNEWNSAPVDDVSRARSWNFVVTPPALATTSYTTNYTSTEQARVLKSATYLGVTPQELQKSGVGLLEYLLLISNPRPPPQAMTPPALTGPVAYTSTWTSVDIGTLRDVQAQYSLTPQQTQKFGVQLVGFLLALGGH